MRMCRRARSTITGPTGGTPPRAQPRLLPPAELRRRPLVGVEQRVVVRSQENRWACARAPCDNAARRPGPARPPPTRPPRAPARCPSTSSPDRPSAHRDRQPAHRAPPPRRPAGLRLQRDQPERLVVARHRDDVRGPEDLDQPVRGLRREEATTSSSPRRPASCCNAGRLGQAAARRPARHEHHQPRRAARAPAQGAPRRRAAARPAP